MNFPAWEKLLWIDYSIGLLILVSAVIGLVRGFVREALALATWIAAIWVGIHYAGDLTPLLQKSIEYPPLCHALSFGALFLLTLLVGGIVRYILQHLVDSTGLSGSNRILGMLFGFMRGAVFLALLVIFAGMTSLPQEVWWQQSQFLPPFQAFAVWLKVFIPAEMAGSIHFR